MSCHHVLPFICDAGMRLPAFWKTLNRPLVWIGFEPVVRQRQAQVLAWHILLPSLCFQPFAEASCRHALWDRQRAVVMQEIVEVHSV